MNLFETAITTTAVLLLFVLLGGTGCATKGKALRPASNPDNSPRTDAPLATASFIETKPDQGPIVSCSFVEFDERGDYLDFKQHTNAWEKVRSLSATNTNGLILVIYCHGWKNNVHSGDVVEFNNFLIKIARSKPVEQAGQRVHGLYLGWRGNVVEHYVNPKSRDFEATTNAFGGPIVDLTRARGSRYFPTILPENVSYWDRKGAAEFKVSGVPMARTVMTCAHAAKSTPDEVGRNQVFVMGHSLGALMLEKSLGQACVSALTAAWPWGGKESVLRSPATPVLPFDGILFLNSAAPSVQSKELADFLWAHSRALGLAHRPDWDSPTIVSLTSETDRATGVAHRYANALAGFYPSLQRSYRDAVLKTNACVSPVPPPVQQSYFYQRTPGHNPLLVNHWITATKRTDADPQPPAPTHHDVMAHNLNTLTDKTNSMRFYTSPADKRPFQLWEVSRVPWEPDWAKYKGHEPVYREGYYIVRCKEQIIDGHGDIWNEQALETYAGLFRMVAKLREPSRQKFRRELEMLKERSSR